MLWQNAAGVKPGTFSETLYFNLLIWNCDQAVPKICQEYRKIYKNIEKLRDSIRLILNSLLGKSLIFSAFSCFCAFYTR